MNENNPTQIPVTGSLTRRSFIKRSVVAAVAVTSMTIFSGLVDAARSPEPYNPLFVNHCTAEKWEGTWGEGNLFPQGQEFEVMYCKADPCVSGIVKCGRFYKLDANDQIRIHPVTGIPMTEAVEWNCDDMEDNPFHGPDQPAEVPTTKIRFRQ